MIYSDAWKNLRDFFNYNNYKVVHCLYYDRQKNIVFQRDTDFFIEFLPTNNANPQSIELYEYGSFLEDFDVGHRIDC